MRAISVPAILIALLFLFIAPVRAERIRNEQYDFSITIPDGFERVPEMESMRPGTIYAYRKLNPDGMAELILIQHLGGIIGREHMGADGKLPGKADAMLSMRWSDFDVDAAEVPESVNGVKVLSYNIQVPLKPEALQITVAGGSDRKAELLSIGQTLLNGLEGKTNWLRSLVSRPPGSESQYRFWMVITGIVFVCGGLAVIWLIARRNPCYCHTDSRRRICYVLVCSRV